MAGYSGAPLARKLGLRDGQRVAFVGLPEDLSSLTTAAGFAEVDVGESWTGFGAGRAALAAGLAAGFFGASFVLRPLFDWAVAFMTLPARSSSRASATPAYRRTDQPPGRKTGCAAPAAHRFPRRKASPGATPRHGTSRHEAHGAAARFSIPLKR